MIFSIARFFRIKNRLFFLPILILFSASLYLIYQNHQKKQSAPLASRSNDRAIASYTLEHFEIQDRAKKILQKGQEQYESGNYAQSNKFLSQLLNQYPYAGHREPASCLLAQGLFHTGDWDQSLQVISRLKEHNPDPQSPWLACVLVVEGQIYEKRDQIDKAIKLYREVIVSFPSSPVWAQKAEDLLMQISF